MIILACNQVTKYYGIDLILDRLTFSLQAGEKAGLVGMNGAGKSTLFKILCHSLPYDEGELFIAKGTNLGYLEQLNQFDEKLTVYEEALTPFAHFVAMEQQLRDLEHQIADLSQNAASHPELDTLMEAYARLTETFESNGGYAFRSETRGVLKGLGFLEADFSQPVGQLSGGEKTRLSLVKLLLSKPDVLLLDEPTNHLDIEAVEWLEGFLKDYPGALLLISHDRYFLDQVVSRILEIENKHITSFNGNFTDYAKNKLLLLEQRMREYQNQQVEVARQEDIIRRLRQHGTEKLMKRAKSREKLLDKIELTDKPQAYQKRAHFQFETYRPSGNNVLHVEQLGKSFDGTELFSQVTFPLYRGEKVALIGPNGIGKSTLMKMILGLEPVTEGSIQLGHQVYPAYYDQEQRILKGTNRVIDEIWDEHPLKDETEIRTLLGAFLFHGEEVFKPVSALSGGERARLSLLKLILSKSNFLLMDEPTNHLDIQSKEVLEEALLQYEGTLLVISHDRYFLNRIANKVLVLGPQGTETYLGNYDYYLYKKREQLLSLEEAPQPEKTKTQLKDERRKEKEEKSKQKAQVRAQQELEEKIMALEESLAELEALMCQEEVYANPEKSKEIQQQSAERKAELATLYEAWENIVDNG